MTTKVSNFTHERISLVQINGLISNTPYERTHVFGVLLGQPVRFQDKKRDKITVRKQISEKNLRRRKEEEVTNNISPENHCFGGTGPDGCHIAGVNRI